MAESTKKKKVRDEKRLNQNKEIEAQSHQSKKDEFTATHFKFMLRDKETAAEGFQKFIEATARDDYDIVQEYVTSSLECAEIFDVLDREKLKANELALAFNCFEKILLHITEKDELEEYFSVGKHVVTKLLTSYKSNIMSCLNMKVKAGHIKPAIKLLTAMVMLSSLTASLVLSNINLTDSTISILFKRRDSQDKEDVRTCLLHLLIAFMLSDDNEVIRKLVDITDLFDLAFYEMVYDRMAVVQLFLNTVAEKVVRNTGISKTAKTRLFSSTVLNSLANLFKWRGPVKHKEKLQNESSSKDSETQADRPDQELIDRMAELVYHFLLEICTSYTNGIIFKDVSMGTSERNNNQKLTKFLLTLTFAQQNKFARELVIKSLSACPQQIPFFLPNIRNKLEPQLTKIWTDYVDLVCKIYKSLPTEPPVFKTKEHRSVEQTVEILLLYTCPPAQFTSVFLPGYKKHSVVKNHLLLKMVHIFSDRAVKILTLLNGEDGTDSRKQKWLPEEKREIVALYKKAVIQSIPEPKIIYGCFELSLKNRNEEQLTKLKEFTEGDWMEVDVRIVQTFCVYQELLPFIMVDNHLVLTRLIDHIMQHYTSDNYLPQISLLKLLAGTDARKLPWAKQNKKGHTLMYQLLEMTSQLASIDSVRTTSLELLCKLLVNTGLFDGFAEELTVWIKPLQSQKGLWKDICSLLGFVSTALTSYMNNPYPYMDKVSDLVSEAAFLKTGGLERSSTMDNEEKFRAVVAMDIDNLDEDDEEELEVMTSFSSSTKRFPFCPVLLVALDSFKKIPEKVEDIRNYLSLVIVDIFHQQVDPVAMCLQLQQCEPDDLLDGVQTYILTWLPNSDSPKKSPKKKKKKEAKSNQVLTLQRYEDMVHANTILQVEQVDCVTFVRQQLLHLRYILGHMESNDSFLEKVSVITQNICEKVEGGFSSVNKEIESGQVKKHLSILETTVKEPAALSSVKTVLTNSIVMENFFCENTETQSTEIRAKIESVFTDLVIHLLGIISSNNMSVGSVIDYYHRKILELLKMFRGLSEAQQQQILPSLYSYLKLMIQALDIGRCEEVFHNLLSIQTSGGNTDICSILNNLILKLNASSIRNFKMSETSISQLISCFLETDNIEEIGNVIEFFYRFPALAVLCPYQQFLSVLNSKNFERLAAVLIQNNCLLRSQFEDSLNRDEDDISSQTNLIPVIVEVLKIHTTKISENNSDPPEVIHAVRKKFEPKVLQIAGLDNDEDAAPVFELFQLLMKVEAFNKKFIKKLEKKVRSSLTHEDTAGLQTYHVQMADVILNCPLSESNSDVNHQLLRLCTECLSNVLSKKKHSNFTVAKELLDILLRIPKEDIQTFPSTWDAFKELWPAFCFKTLRYLYTDIKTLKVLTKFVSVIYADSADVGLPAEKLVSMVTSHTSFLPVMFNEKTEEVKDALVDLIMELLVLSPESREASHVAIYLGAYGATLSLTDQKILKLLHMYETNGIDFHEFRPYLWGERAIEHQTISPQDKLSLLQMKMGKVLKCINSDKMRDTICNFPLTRRLLDHEVREAEKYRGLATTYDPLFFLSQFSFLLGPNRHVQSKPFVEHEGLGLVFAALSSHDRAVRSAAYSILEHYRLHIQEGRFQGQDDLVYMLRLLKNSLTEPICKLAPLITIFLARACRLLFEPGNHMYSVIKSFLAAKPTLDIFDIPEFYKLFNSSDAEHKTERLWILTLMLDGLREIADYRIFEKRYSFKVLFSFYDTETADTESQVKVLQIVKSACKERAMAVSLCHEHGLVPWIATVISKLSPEKKRHVTEVVHIMHTVWSTMAGKAETSKENSGHLDPIFVSQILTLVKALLWVLRDVKKEVLHLHLNTLMSVVKQSTVIGPLSKHDATTTISSCVVYSDLLVILVLAQRIRGEDFLVRTALNILSCMGYSTEILEKPNAQQLFRKGLLQPVDGNDEPAVKSDEEKNVQTTEDLEEDQEQAKKAVIERVKEKTEEDEICRNLLTLIIRENCKEVKVYLKELLAASVVFIEWVLNRLENRNDSDMLADGLKFVCRLFSDNHCLVEIICSESDAGNRIITGFLNLYSVIYSEHVKQFSECVQLLNMILVKIVEKKFGKQITGLANEEEKSCLLRKIFVSDASTDLSELITQSQTKSFRKSGKRKAELENRDVTPGKKHKRKSWQYTSKWSFKC